jgi:glycerophosphoryl diester phosphodiesterase
MAPARRPLALAHRGDHSRHPENSLPALLAALERPGCDGIELDVRASRNGVLVIYHDATLERLHGRPERVADLSAAELGALGVTTLEAVLAAVPRRAFLDVDVKVDLGRALIEVLAAGRGPALSRAVISSFEGRALARVRELARDWPTWLNARDLLPGTLDRAIELGCAGVSVEWHAIDAASLARAQTAGLDVAAWTVRRRPTRDRLARLGLVAICLEGAALIP